MQNNRRKVQKYIDGRSKVLGYLQDFEVSKQCKLSRNRSGQSIVVQTPVNKTKYKKDRQKEKHTHTKRSFIIDIKPMSIEKNNYMNRSDFNLANDLGISPSKLFSNKSMLINWFKLPNSSGIFPWKLFRYNSLQTGVKNKIKPN